MASDVASPLHGAVEAAAAPADAPRPPPSPSTLGRVSSSGSASSPSKARAKASTTPPSSMADLAAAAAVEPRKPSALERFEERMDVWIDVYWTPLENWW